VYYIDTSALTKLVVPEDESSAIVAWWVADPAPKVASELTRTELLRAVTRTHPDRLLLAEEVLGRITLIDVTRHLLDRAGHLRPPTVRTLDAIHLATAIELAPELTALVTYDSRMADAAAPLGLRVEAPGTERVH